MAYEVSCNNNNNSSLKAGQTHYQSLIDEIDKVNRLRYMPQTLHDCAAPPSDGSVTATETV